MTRLEKNKKFEEKYGINVIAEGNGRIIYELDGYIHDISKNDISRLRLDNPSTMISSSYIKYINDTKLKNTSLKAIEIDGIYIVYVNTETQEWAKIHRHQIDIESMISITSKCNKYRNEIIKALGNKYNYDNCWPEHSNDIVELECPIHGKFSARTSNLIYNLSGCPHCANELKGYTRHKYIASCEKNNDGHGTLYLAKISDGNETFLKIGITSYPNTENRFIELNRLYTEVISLLVVNADPAKVYNLEHYIHRTFIPYKYIPLKEFNGRQECYSIDALDDLMSIICKKL